jgi:hypothetical protein
MPIRHTNKQTQTDRLTVLKDGAIRQIYPGALVRDNDDSSAKSDLATEMHITSNRQMVEFEDVGNGTEALLEVGNLPKVHQYRSECYGSTIMTIPS